MTPGTIRLARLTLTTAVYLGALGALGYWGYHMHDRPGKLILGLGLPAVGGVLWWLFAAPKAFLFNPVLRGVTDVVVPGGGTVALYAAGKHHWAFAFAALAIAHVVLRHLP